MSDDLLSSFDLNTAVLPRRVLRRGDCDNFKASHTAGADRVAASEASQDIYIQDGFANKKGNADARRPKWLQIAMEAQGHTLNLEPLIP